MAKVSIDDDVLQQPGLGGGNVLGENGARRRQQFERLRRDVTRDRGARSRGWRRNRSAVESPPACRGPALSAASVPPPGRPRNSAHAVHLEAQFVSVHARHRSPSPTRTGPVFSVIRTSAASVGTSRASRARTALRLAVEDADEARAIAVLGSGVPPVRTARRGCWPEAGRRLRRFAGAWLHLSRNLAHTSAARSCSIEDSSSRASSAACSAASW